MSAVLRPDKSVGHGLAPAGAPADPLRRARLFLTALWGGPPGEDRVLPMALPAPRLTEGRLYLSPTVSANTARAAAAHAGAHLAYSTQCFDTADLKARQRVLIETVEDARVEALASREFPGLRRLWREQLGEVAVDVQDFDHLLQRLAIALLLPDRHDPNAWVARGQRLFYAEPVRWADPRFARELGLLLASDLGQMRIAMNEGRPVSVAAYRDDNTHLWTTDRALAREEGSPQAVDAIGVRSARLRETDTGASLSLVDGARADTETGYAIQPVTEQAALEYREGAEASLSTSVLAYPEWDYRIQRLKQDWVQVLDRRPSARAPAVAEEVLGRYRSVIERLHRQIAAVHHQSRRRLRRQVEGDELDLDGVIENRIAMQGGQTPDGRVYMRHHLHSEQELALLVLLDLSASTRDALREAPERSVLDVTREAAIVLADALSRLGHRFAIHGFNSDGRQALHYQRLLDFDEPYGAEQAARLGAMQGEFSTRMGAAIRHATRCLAAQPAAHRLLLVITDGAPSDIDVHDPRLLIEDAHHAVVDALGHDVLPYCLSLDAEADAYVTHIFGAHRHAVMQRVTDLPRHLPEVYFRLVRRYLG